MFGPDSAKFITAITFAASSVLLVIVAYTVHILISNRRLNLAHKKLQALTARLSSAEESERKRIAEELHDRIGETLVVTSRSIEELKGKMASEEAGRDLDQLGKTIQKFLKGTRSLIFDLIPPALYDIGLEAAVESFVARSKKRYQIDLRMIDDGKEKPLATDAAAFLYKAIRELVLNVVKHSNAHQATITLMRQGGDYKVVVEDNGVGFSQNGAGHSDAGSSGFGLFNIQVQAEYYGGSVQIDSALPAGGRVTMSVPLKPNRKNEDSRPGR